MEYNKIIRGGCLEYMKQLPDKSIDLIVTDPHMERKQTKAQTASGRRKIEDMQAAGIAKDQTKKCSMKCAVYQRT